MSKIITLNGLSTYTNELNKKIINKAICEKKEYSVDHYNITYGDNINIDLTETQRNYIINKTATIVGDYRFTGTDDTDSNIQIEVLNGEEYVVIGTDGEITNTITQEEYNYTIKNELDLRHSFTYVVKDNDSLVYWLTNGEEGASSGGKDFERVLIKSGDYIYPKSTLVSYLDVLGTKEIVGEGKVNISKIFDDTPVSATTTSRTFFKYKDIIPEAKIREYRIENVNLDIDYETTKYAVVQTGMSNCVNIKNCSVRVNGCGDRGSGACYGFSNCTNIENCYGVCESTWTNMVFGSCKNLYFCSGAITRGLYAMPAVFMSCYNLNNCFIDNNKNVCLNGYYSCKKLNSCSVFFDDKAGVKTFKSKGIPAFYKCEELLNCNFSNNCDTTYISFENDITSATFSLFKFCKRLINCFVDGIIINQEDNSHELAAEISMFDNCTYLINCYAYASTTIGSITGYIYKECKIMNLCCSRSYGKFKGYFSCYADNGTTTVSDSVSGGCNMTE